MKVLVTGGAGYIGSLLTGVLLERGDHVLVVDDLRFGGESLLGYWHHPRFRFIRADVTAALDPGLCAGVDAVVHLAAVVGYPACQALGRERAWQQNVGAVQTMFAAAEAAGVGRFVFASTYSNYGLAKDGEPVSETSELFPQSLYAETKIAAEQYLLQQAPLSKCMPLIFRFATIFGISPRTRFDLILNQFVLEAVTKKELVVYERGYSRSFVHVRDVVAGICLGLDAPAEKVRGEVYNLGAESGNCTKDELIALVQKHVAGWKLQYKEMSFAGDMRDITVSFAKVRQALGFEPQFSVEQGVVEVRDAIQQGLIKNTISPRYQNADFTTQ